MSVLFLSCLINRTSPDSFECLLGERAAAVARVRAEHEAMSSRLEVGDVGLRTARAERDVLTRALEKQVRNTRES